MISNKIPIKLIWQLFDKIFNDLDINDLTSNYFSNLKVSPSNCYELIYGLIIKLLLETHCIHKGYKEGITDDLFNINIDKTIVENTLYDCQVYGSKYKYVWYCQEHSIFLQVLKICSLKSSKDFLRQPLLIKALKSLEQLSGVSFDFMVTDIDRALSLLKLEYDFDTDTLCKYSLFNRNEQVYLNLCRFAKVVLMSENITTDLNGINNCNYNKIDWYIIQQYCVREIWNVINKQKYLTGKKHRDFQSTIYTGNAQALRPDAIYIFDGVGLRDCIIDVKLYSKSCLDSYNHYRFSNELNKSLAYQNAYPEYIRHYKNKSSRKNITCKDVNSWIIHFRKNISDYEKEFSGKRVYEGFGDIGIFIIDMFEGCNIKDLDKQIEDFVLNNILIFS